MNRTVASAVRADLIGKDDVFVCFDASEEFNLVGAARLSPCNLLHGVFYARR